MRGGIMTEKEEKTKEQKIKSEVSKLKKIYKEIDKDRMVLAIKLIENAAFMTVTLKDLQEQIVEEGSIVTATNGNGFETTQENPAQKAYNAMMQRFTPCIKQLTDMLPSSKAAEAKKAGDALKEFISAGKPKGRSQT